MMNATAAGYVRTGERVPMGGRHSERHVGVQLPCPVHVDGLAGGSLTQALARHSTWALGSDLPVDPSNSNEWMLRSSHTTNALGCGVPQVVWTDETERALEDYEAGSEDAVKNHAALCSTRLNALVVQVAT